MKMHFTIKICFFDIFQFGCPIKAHSCRFDRYDFKIYIMNEITNDVIKITVIPRDVICNGMQGAMQVKLNKS